MYLLRDQDRVDEKAFRKTERGAFKRNIDYLLEAGILPLSCYQFLDYAREVRNTRLHSPPLENNYSEEDFRIFGWAHWRTDKIHMSEMKGLDTEGSSALKTRLKSEAERGAAELLKEQEQQQITPHSTGFAVET